MYEFKSLTTLLTNDTRYLELESFKHAISTPLTILLSSMEEGNASNILAVNKRYKNALLTLKQLTHNFHENKIERCDIGELLQEIKTLLQDKNTIHIINVSKKKVFVHSVNKSRLKEALVCLIKNAAESGQHHSNSVVMYNASEHAVTIYVKDFGRGIAWWQKLIIGFPFLSFKENGRGIGLFFAKQVITNELSGMFSIYSTIGMGTSIECKIPIHR